MSEKYPRQTFAIKGDCIRCNSPVPLAMSPDDEAFLAAEANGRRVYALCVQCNTKVAAERSRRAATERARKNGVVRIILDFALGAEDMDAAARLSWVLFALGEVGYDRESLLGASVAGVEGSA